MTNRDDLRHRAFGVAVVAAAALVLGACGTDAPVAPRTTTVTVTPTAKPSSTTATTSTTTTTTSAALDQPPTTFDQAMQHLGAGKVDAGAKPVFTSPTGNIFCSVAASNGVPAGCEVRDGRVQPPPGTCPTGGGGGAQDVGRIEWSADSPKPICNSDSIYQPGSQVLQYGAIAKVNGSPIQCVSEMIGMTCVNSTSKKGFFLAKGVYKIF